MRDPVASQTASASAISKAAAGKSPRQVNVMACEFKSSANWSSAPTSRATRVCRTVIACQASSSHSSAAATCANQPHRSRCSTGTSAPAKVRTAWRSLGAAAARPSVMSSARPSSKRSSSTRLRRRRQVQSGAGHLGQVPGARQAPGEQRCAPRAEVSITRHVEVERFETIGRFQQLGGCVAAQTRGERDLASQQVDSGTGKPIQRPGLRLGEQLEGVIERSGLEVGHCRGQRALGAAHWFGRQEHRALQERHGGS